MSYRSTIFCALLLSTGLIGCGLHGKPKVERQKSMQSMQGPQTTSEAVDPARIVAPGIVESWGEEVNLSAQESGWIAQIVVKEGDHVESGQLLATLEDSAQRSDLAVARAGVVEAEAALARVQRGATAEELRQAEANYNAAEARDALSRSSAARTTRLHEGGAVANTEAERADSDAQVQAALAESAQARLAELKRGPRYEDRLVARARLDAAHARFDAAQAALDRRRISAPKAGSILFSRYHVGEFFNVAGTAMFNLGDVSRLQSRLEVDEIDSAAVKVGAECGIFSDAGRHLGDGTVIRLAPRMGRRGLAIETPTAREDVRVREVFVEINAGAGAIPGQRVWGHVKPSPPSLPSM